MGDYRESKNTSQSKERSVRVKEIIKNQEISKYEFMDWRGSKYRVEIVK